MSLLCWKAWLIGSITDNTSQWTPRSGLLQIWVTRIFSQLGKTVILPSRLRDESDLPKNCCAGNTHTDLPCPHLPAADACPSSPLPLLPSSPTPPRHGGSLLSTSWDPGRLHQVSTIPISFIVGIYRHSFSYWSNWLESGGIFWFCIVFRCDSVSQQLPLSVSGWVSQWVIDSFRCEDSYPISELRELVSSSFLLSFLL